VFPRALAGGQNIILDVQGELVWVWKYGRWSKVLLLGTMFLPFKMECMGRYLAGGGASRGMAGG
jgi:hypothetical protein